jgi:hypothetical protein
MPNYQNITFTLSLTGLVQKTLADETVRYRPDIELEAYFTYGTGAGYADRVAAVDLTATTTPATFDIRDAILPIQEDATAQFTAVKAFAIQIDGTATSGAYVQFTLPAADAWTNWFDPGGVYAANGVENDEFLRVYCGDTYYNTRAQNGIVVASNNHSFKYVASAGSIALRLWAVGIG